MKVRIADRSTMSGLGLMAALGLLIYDAGMRWWMRDWGSTEAERRKRLPGDEIIEDVMTHHTKALTIEAPPEAVWPWLVQIGDRRGGFYSYDWLERATGTVHYTEGTHSATRIHPELQDVKVGDHIDTASIGTGFRVGAPVTVVEPNHALVVGSWAFVLEPLPEGRTRFFVRERYPGWIRMAIPKRFGILRALGGAIDYLFGEPLHFVMERKMMLGLKERVEGTSHGAAPKHETREVLKS